MNNHILRTDIQVFLENRGIRLARLASNAGVDAGSLWRFVKGHQRNLTTDNLFRLWPFIYGKQRPKPLGSPRMNRNAGTASPADGEALCPDSAPNPAGESHD